MIPKWAHVIRARMCFPRVSGDDPLGEVTFFVAG